MDALLLLVFLLSDVLSRSLQRPACTEAGSMSGHGRTQPYALVSLSRAAMSADLRLHLHLCNRQYSGLKKHVRAFFLYQQPFSENQKGLNMAIKVLNVLLYTHYRAM